MTSECNERLKLQRARENSERRSVNNKLSRALAVCLINHQRMSYQQSSDARLNAPTKRSFGTHVENYIAADRGSTSVMIGITRGRECWRAAEYLLLRRLQIQYLSVVWRCVYMKTPPKRGYRQAVALSVDDDGSLQKTRAESRLLHRSTAYTYIYSSMELVDRQPPPILYACAPRAVVLCCCQSFLRRVQV